MSRGGRALVHLHTLLCVLWAGAAVVVGVPGDNSTAQMYSNLRYAEPM